MINFKVFLTLLEKIDKLLSDTNNKNLKDSLELVKEESKKQSWNKKLMELVDKGISLLATC